MKSILIIGITLISVFNVNAQKLMASKEGQFENFNRCLLFDNKGVIEIGYQSGANIIQTTVINTPVSYIKNLAAPAIKGAGSEYYKWAPNQTDYSVRSIKGFLKKFYSTGFKNIDNDSKAAKELISKVNQICDKQVNDFKILGEFQVDLKIGNTLFADKLIVKRVPGALFGARIEGLYQVPGSFESKIQSLNYIDGTFSFIIRVQEGTDDYKAIFEGTLSPNDKLTGKAYILPDRKLLGSFTGKRI